MSADEPVDLALQVAALLDRLGIPYVVGGSLASSILGEPRATVDIDLAVRLREADLPRLVGTLGGTFYVSPEAAREAVRARRSFNAVHLESIQKLDFFVHGEGLLDRRQLERRRRVRLSEEPARELWITSAEDQILRKLEWYRAGGGVSDRPWRDVVSILAVQGESIDRRDLADTAARLGQSELLESALRDSGLE